MNESYGGNIRPASGARFMEARAGQTKPHDFRAAGRRSGQGEAVRVRARDLFLVGTDEHTCGTVVRCAGLARCVAPGRAGRAGGAVSGGPRGAAHARRRWRAHATPRRRRRRADVPAARLRTDRATHAAVIERDWSRIPVVGVSRLAGLHQTQDREGPQARHARRRRRDLEPARAVQRKLELRRQGPRVGADVLLHIPAMRRRFRKRRTGRRRSCSARSRRMRRAADIN